MIKTKKVPGFENYSVSSDGRVYSKRGELKPSTSTGYASVKFPMVQKNKISKFIAWLQSCLFRIVKIWKLSIILTATN